MGEVKTEKRKLKELRSVFIRSLNLIFNAYKGGHNTIIMLKRGYKRIKLWKTQDTTKEKKN